ncbi:hypothetical protein [Streptomyces sp. SID9124]|uniref:hypothetical protein n=1 Tax=Streptomyces sp. SID9124 TaxID=2706108 RepID=UPI0013E0B0FA|nr:hypothetical protein [Streptomyces sp. SID9124]NED12076.1 hypothetical protein [Streptomyces sp. SID9124]
MNAQTAWPKGVLARYLTAGGATVDLTYRLTVHNPPQPYATLATCTGCVATNEVSQYVSRWGVEEHAPEIADAESRTWAQSHAETCRAMPKPTA